MAVQKKSKLTKTTILFYSNLNRLMKEYGVNRTNIEQSMGIQVGRLKFMESRNSFPQGTTIDKLAAFFDVPHSEFFVNLGYIDEEE